MSRDEGREVLDSAVLKQIKRAAESDGKRTARLKLHEIFIPQWPELDIIDKQLFYNCINAIYPSRASLSLKMFYTI